MALRFVWDPRKLLGLSSRRRLVVVAHTERGGFIRIIKARRANRRERRTYEEED